MAIDRIGAFIRLAIPRMKTAPSSTPMAKTPIRVGIIGMGGYAARHHEALIPLEAAGEARLVCTCDPAPASFAAKSAEWKLSDRGVTIHDDYRKMLDRHAGELDVVTVPTPIPLHAEMHRAGVERGLATSRSRRPSIPANSRR